MLILPLKKLKQILIDKGLITTEEFDAMVERAKRKRQNIVEALAAQGYLTLDYYYDLLSDILKVERVKLKNVGIQEDAFYLLPQDLAQEYKVCVFNREKDGTLDIGMEDPTNLEIIEFLEKYLKAKVHPVLVSDEDLNWAFSLYQRKTALSFRKMIEESVAEALRAGTKAEKKLKEIATMVPIAAIVDNLISYAASLSASDIHLEILEDCLLVRFRIDGILYEMIRLPKQIHPAIVARIKLLSGLAIDEHSRPQDGRFRYKTETGAVDMRVSVMPTFFGEKIAIRLLAATQKPFSFEELGMLRDTIKLVKKNIAKTYGMILVCGPTGSGKTTTLYSILNLLNQPGVNIVTIEDPVEYNISYLNQTQINPKAGITFANGLRAILRQDPDIIMVGEIRDRETAEIAVHSALTGHLILSSLHTSDAPTAIPRLIDMGIPAYLVAAVLNAVVAQRLVRTIHKPCIESYKPDKGTISAIKEQLRVLGIDPSEVRIPKTLYRGRGCPGCNFTGYSGRTAIFEVLDVTKDIRDMITLPDFSLDALKELSRSKGMTTMFEDGLLKVERGITTIEEVLRVAR